jgi:ketosteroid isomerase-like protein
MNRPLRLFCLGLMLFCGSSLLASPASPPDKARLQQVLDAWASMDLTRPAMFYAKDPGLAFYDIAPRKYNGWSEYEKGVGELFKTLKSASFRLKDDAVVHTAGNMAWATALVDGDMVNKDGSKMKIDARWTTVWEKRGNNWLIVHDHFSMPLPEAAPKPAAKSSPRKKP